MVLLGRRRRRAAIAAFLRPAISSDALRLTSTSFALRVCASAANAAVRAGRGRCFNAYVTAAADSALICAHAAAARLCTSSAMASRSAANSLSAPGPSSPCASIVAARVSFAGDDGCLGSAPFPDAEPTTGAVISRADPRTGLNSFACADRQHANLSPPLPRRSARGLRYRRA